MKLLLTAAALTTTLTASLWAIPSASPKPQPNTPIQGDYVEARTAAVFAGACHYNGEYVTTGRDAILAWNFTAGSTNNINLAGIKAIAAVTSDKNLSDPSPTRKSEILINPEATEEQAAAVVSLLKEKCGPSLGTITQVRRAPITFTRTDNGYTVNAPNFASLTLQSLPDNSCCKQPGDVWYEPLSPTQNRKVGYTEQATFNGTLTPPWYRSDENSAFYGRINF